MAFLFCKRRCHNAITHAWLRRCRSDSYIPGRLQSLAYCDTSLLYVLCRSSAITGAIEMSHLALVETLMKVLQGVCHAPTPTPTISLPHFLSRPQSPSDPTINQWLADFDVFVRQCCVSKEERAVMFVDYLGGCAKEEVLCQPVEVRRDFGALVSLLRRVFGPWETVTSLYAEF